MWPQHFLKWFIYPVFLSKALNIVGDYTYTIRIMNRHYFCQWLFVPRKNIQFFRNCDQIIYLFENWKPKEKLEYFYELQGLF